MLILRDVKELFDIDIGDNYFGVTRDIYVVYYAIRNESIYDRYYENLGLEKHEDYFNAGCMICNVKKMREDNLTKKLIEKLCEIKNPRFLDQCILNAVCHNQVKYISNNWNFTWHVSFVDNYLSYLPSPYKEDYLSAKADPYIIHFTAIGKKPWINPSLQKSDIWWQYARMTPFYEEILYINLRLNLSQVKNAINYNKNRWKYWRYKILSKITFGKIGKKYKEKRGVFKEKMRQAREFL
jgi:lipopolysaccharide biosynthesis glycosyltransferase